VSFDRRLHFDNTAWVASLRAVGIGRVLLECAIVEPSSVRAVHAIASGSVPSDGFQPRRLLFMIAVEAFRDAVPGLIPG
jgi:hypothetical protein